MAAAFGESVFGKEKEENEDERAARIRRKAAAAVDGGLVAGWLALNRDLLGLI
jgi:hypothetical protein